MNDHALSIAVSALCLAAVAGSAAAFKPLVEQPKTIAEDAGSERIKAGLALIARQLSEQDVAGPKRRIAVIDFSDIQGRVPSVGVLVSELLINELFKTGKYDIVERKLLSGLLEQHKLNMSGLVDERTARKVGKLLGVDSIVAGTVIDLGDVMNVNARMISIETGVVTATGSADLGKAAFRQLAVTANDVSPAGRASYSLDDLPPAQGEFTPWLSAEPFGREMDRLWKDGYYPAVAEGRDRNGVREFRAIVQPFPKRAFWFYWWYDQLRSQYEEHRKRLVSEGFREIHVQVFTDRDGMKRYQTCWIKYGR